MWYLDLNNNKKQKSEENQDADGRVCGCVGGVGDAASACVLTSGSQLPLLTYR
jgi:hypothetical protein